MVGLDFVQASVYSRGSITCPQPYYYYSNINAVLNTGLFLLVPPPPSLSLCLFVCVSVCVTCYLKVCGLGLPNGELAAWT